MSDTIQMGQFNPIKSPATWHAADLQRDQSWILVLSSDDQQEVKDAVALVTAKGLRAGEFEQEDFPLPQVSKLLKKALREVKHGRGAVLLRGLPVDPTDPEHAAKIVWGLGTYLGHAMMQSPGVNLGKYKNNLISYIMDQRLDPNDRNVHGSATGAEQQPHSDPSELVALLCVRPAQDGGGVSRIVSAMTIFNELVMRYPDALPTLFRGFRNDLRSESKTGMEASVTPPIPVYGVAENFLSVNFNSRTIELASEKLNQPLSVKERRALDAMIETATRHDLVFETMLQTGDLQLLNNYTVLHSRTAWNDPPQTENRRLMIRMWYRTDSPRPLPAGFESGYLTGVSYDVGEQAKSLRMHK